MLDPAYLGRGLGRRILAAFVEVLAGEGFRRLQLEVGGYNGRAIAAYLASGFAVSGEYWADPEPGLDVESLLESPAAEAIAANAGSTRTAGIERESFAWNDGSAHNERPLYGDPAHRPHRTRSRRNAPRGRRVDSPANRTAIARALGNGIRVVLVTGRGVDTPIKVSRELGLNLPVICCHGALTKDFGANKTLVHLPVPLEYAKAMLEFADRNRVHVAVYAEETSGRSPARTCTART